MRLITTFCNCLTGRDYESVLIGGTPIQRLAVNPAMRNDFTTESPPIQSSNPPILQS